MTETDALAAVHPRSIEADTKSTIRFERISCPGCGADDAEFITRTRDYETEIDLTFAVQQCRQCGLAYTSPRPCFEDLLEVFYGDDYLCYQSSGLLDRMRVALLGKSHLKLFAQYVPPEGRILDVGCATGSMLGYLQAHTDWQLHGCEPKKPVAEVARRRGIEVVPATLREANFGDDFFDLVHMSHVIEHLPDLNETVAEVFRVLKPGGTFITENPDFSGATRGLFKDAWWGYHLPRHLTHFTPKSITRFLERHGFEAIRVEACFRPSLLAWSVQNLIKLKGGPSFLSKIFGQTNPAFVAAMFPVEYLNLRSGKTDVIKTFARKPAS